MKQLRRIVTGVICSAMILGMMPAAVSAENENIFPEEAILVESKFEWPGQMESFSNQEVQKTTGKDEQAACYYSDRYFMKSAEEEDPGLRTMSLALGLTSFSSNEAGDEGWTTDTSAACAKWQNARELLIGDGTTDHPGLGFRKDSFTVNDAWGQKPERDSIGLIAAMKEMTDGTPLVALVIRGGGYGMEWASNLTIGNSGDHEGFAKAKKDTLDFLEAYLKKMNLSGPIKLWLVGYSRAGVTANMVGEALDRHEVALGTDATVDYDDLYVYTFEPPQGSLKMEESKGQYNNLHNIQNPNDFIPQFAPSSWGFGRSGSDFWIPAPDTVFDYSEKRNRMESILKKEIIIPSNQKNGKDYEYSNRILEKTSVVTSVSVDWSRISQDGRPFIEPQYRDISSIEALNDWIHFLFDQVFLSRDSYYRYREGILREILGAEILGGGDDSDGSETSDGVSSTGELFSGICRNLSFEELMEILSPMWTLSWKDPDSRKEEVRQKIGEFVNEVLSDMQLDDGPDSLGSPKDTMITLLYTLLETTFDDLNIGNLKSVCDFYNFFNLLADGPSEGLSLTNSRVFQAHHPEITLAWLMSMDTHYSGGQDQILSNQLTRKILVDSQMDIGIYDESGMLVASSISNKSPDASGNGIPVFLNEDGVQEIHLPPDAGFRVVMTARGNGETNIDIQEYYYSSGSVNRLLHYGNVKVSPGKEYTLFLPDLSGKKAVSVSGDGSDAEYVLKDADGEVVSPVSELKGTSAQKTFTVYVDVDRKYGLVIGGGTYSNGSTAQVQVFPRNGAEFVGWYQDSIQISQEESCSFNVTEDFHLKAKFKMSGDYPQDEKHYEYCPSQRFQDVDTSRWYHEAIDFILDRGYMKGTGSQLFEPDVSLTRAMIVQILFNLEKQPDSGKTTRFQDVSSEAWYSDAVCWAEKNGLVSGYSADTFGPDDIITREQMITILCRYAEFLGKSVSERSDLSVFSDHQETSGWARTAVQWAVRNEILKGKENGMVEPQAGTTRAEAAQMIMRFLT